MIKLSYINGQMTAKTSKGLKLTDGSYVAGLPGTSGSFRVPIVDGKVTGKVIQYFPFTRKPQLIIENMVDGYIEGVFTSFYLSGRKKEQGNCVHSIREGVCYTWEPGVRHYVSRIVTFRNGDPDGFLYVYDRMSLLRVMKYDNGVWDHQFGNNELDRLAAMRSTPPALPYKEYKHGL